MTVAAATHQSLTVHAMKLDTLQGLGFRVWGLGVVIQRRAL